MMNRSSFPRLAALLLALAPLPSQGAISAKNQKALAEAFALFDKGAYTQAATKAENIPTADRDTRSAVTFFLGTTYAKLQAFDKAVGYYEKAIQAGSKAPSLHYDYGQALFATQKLKEAEAEFKKSIVAKFKMAAAAYYIAYIRSVYDDKKGARDFYLRIQKLSQDPDKVKQSALLQLAELALDEARDLKEDPKKKALAKAKLEGPVLAAYRRARDFNSDSPVAEQARARITEVESMLEQMVERMRNGNPLPRQPYTLLLSQDFTYDTNVTTQADEALVQVSNKDALIWKSGMVAKYQFDWRKTISFIPEFAATFTHHARQDTPTVFQNDNISISPALRTKLEHWSGGKPATAQFDLEFNLTLRDYLSRHQFPFYTRYYNFALSERVKWFDTGNTTLKANIKFTEYYNPAKNSYNPGLSLTQLIRIFGDYSLVNTVSADYLHARDDVNDEKNYKYRGSISFSQLFEKVDVTPAFAIAWKDTMKQSPVRGTETNVAPSVALNRALGKHLDGTLEYTFTKNWSKSKDTYQYTKHETHLGLSYNF